MRWEFTPAATRALLRVQASIPPHAGPEFDPGLELLAALTEDLEGAGAAWLASMGVRLDFPQSEIFQPKEQLPSLAPLDEELFRELGDGCSASRELLRRLPLALTAILRSARQFASEHFSDSTINSEALGAAVFERSRKGKKWLLGAGFNEEKTTETILGTPLVLDEPLNLEPSETPPGLIRLVDAVGNRLREGLRVLEDHARFVSENAWLVESLKKMRHEVDALLVKIPGTARLVQSRDVSGDSGAGLWTGAERERKDTNDIQRSNWKRIQEALRSLEEHAKVVAPFLSRNLESLRYESYTLEKRSNEPPSGLLADSALMLLVSRDCLLGMEKTVRESIRGGVDILQLREKSLPDSELLDLAKKVRLWTRDEGALLILNDRPDLALLAEADGVHLGTTDLSPSDARRILEAGMLVGCSTHNGADRDAYAQAGADYLGVGPIFPSKTKIFHEFAGLDYVRSFADWHGPPWFAIGGIHLDNIGLLRDAGVKRMAISQAICQSEDPQAMARALRLGLGIKPK